MPQYTQTALTSAADQLAVSLRDPQNCYWSLDELYTAILEALRIFQSLTGYYRERATPFPTVAGTAFYDLRSVIPSEYQFTITDDDLLAEIQAHFLEPVTNPWSGTDQFSIASILSAMGNARDSFLLDSGIYITRSTPVGPPPPTGRLNLSQSIIDIRRAAWTDDATTDTFALHRTDEYAAQSFSSSWMQSPGLPYQYSVALTPPASFQLIPAPLNSGVLDLCTTDSGPTLNLDPLSPVVLGVPNDLCWSVKWSTMSQLLSADGDVRDPVRAKYCMDLYNLGVEIARNPVTALMVQVNDVSIPVTSIDDLDKYSPDWQNTSGQPSIAAMVGANLLALSNVPDAVGYSITIDLARSFPVPDVANPSTTYIQLGLELINPILDMAQHICSFKMAGVEFSNTIPLRNNFLRTCALMNARLRSNAFFNLLLNQSGSRQDFQVPRTVPRQPSPEETTA